MLILVIFSVAKHGIAGVWVKLQPHSKELRNKITFYLIVFMLSTE